MKKHPFDPFSFVFGAFFLLVGVLFMLNPDPWVTLIDLQWDWVVPAAVLLAGIVVAYSLLRTQAGVSEESDDGSDLVAAQERLGAEVPPTES